MEWIEQVVTVVLYAVGLVMMGVFCYKAWRVEKYHRKSLPGDQTK